jgi:hypothetical protein
VLTHTHTPHPHPHPHPTAHASKSAFPSKHVYTHLLLRLSEFHTFASKPTLTAAHVHAHTHTHLLLEFVQLQLEQVIQLERWVTAKEHGKVRVMRSARRVTHTQKKAAQMTCHPHT